MTIFKSYFFDTDLYLGLKNPIKTFWSILVMLNPKSPEHKMFHQVFGRRLILNFILAFSATACAPNIVSAEQLSLDLPIKCRPGVDCWLVNLVDHDPNEGFQDFRCLDHGYDGHKGTDIAIRDWEAIRRGVPVLASAAGRIKALRDGMPDQVPSAEFQKKSKKRFCGNGVVIAHGNGWETQYCHLRRNSIVVKPGQEVGRGAKLGFVGHSGNTMFPHVHFSVRHQGRVTDPFVGPLKSSNCKIGLSPLWTRSALQHLSQEMTAIFNVGFASNLVQMQLVGEQLSRTRRDKLTRRSPALIIWAKFFWVKPGDIVKLWIQRPDGRVVVDEKNVLKKRQARRIIFSGKKRTDRLWMRGQYLGGVIIKRTEADGRILRISAKASIDLAD